MTDIDKHSDRQIDKQSHRQTVRQIYRKIDRYGKSAGMTIRQAQIIIYRHQYIERYKYRKTCDEYSWILESLTVIRIQIGKINKQTQTN